MKLLPFPQFLTEYTLAGGKRHWYGYPRAFVSGNEIYVNQDVVFLDMRDYNLLVAHEMGHVIGKEHTPFGVMSPYGLIRYLTS